MPYAMPETTNYDCCSELMEKQDIINAQICDNCYESMADDYTNKLTSCYACDCDIPKGEEVEGAYEIDDAKIYFCKSCGEVHWQDDDEII